MKDDELPTPAGFRDAPMYIYLHLVDLYGTWMANVDKDVPYRHGSLGEIGVPSCKKEITP